MATSFVLYFDYMTEATKSYEYLEMDAKDLEEAIEEADRLYYDNDQPIYLTRIMKKDGKPYKVDGIRVQNYTAMLCKRSRGWHKNNDVNCENEHTVALYTTKDCRWFECL